MNNTESSLKEETDFSYLGLAGARELFKIICDHPHRDLEIDDFWIKRPNEASFPMIKKKLNLMDSNVEIWREFISKIENDPSAWINFG
ncbi:MULTISPECIES: hypothetical protein [Leptospira]|uniref:hypothetical protein n=1 Tax=Leptospira TaxID=171 RepID=UPI001E2A1F57|nr:MULTISPECIES: hypothetical protein [Leptospira]MDQ7245918.1 hypothetical protein [Leptospira borgpetersenii]